MPASDAPHAPLSYSKWDRFEDSDEDTGAAGDEANGRVNPLLSANKAQQQHEADAAVAERFVVYLRQHLKKEYPLSLRKLAARFIGAQHRGTLSSNIYRYNDIVAFAARVSGPVRVSGPRAHSRA